MKIPNEIKHELVFHKVWRYRVTPKDYATLLDIWKCKNCGMWSPYKRELSDICAKKDRRKIERRKNSEY